MPRSYETVLIFDSSLDENQIEEKLGRLKRTLVNGESLESVAVTHWGKRRLAYPIGKKEQGTYVVLRYDTEPDRLPEFERLARLDEQVLRQLTVVDPVESRPAVAATGSPPAASAARREEDGEE
ncbi:MAG TPA: 30S ribosomal protein S6 [Gemmatimonadota bacterium]|nr:30S ribosomal protein S6 [Gemmatimonadota bacterium]